MEDFSLIKDYKGLLSRVTLAMDETRDKPFYYIYTLQELQDMIVNTENVPTNNIKKLSLNDELLYNNSKWKIIDFSFEVCNETDYDFMKYGMSTRSSGQQYPYNFELNLIVEEIE